MSALCMRASRNFKMVSRDEDAWNLEMVFTRDSSVSRQEKIKAFWKFFDEQSDLQPHQGTLEVKTPPPETTLPICTDEALDEKNVWRKQLGVFQQLGLDKIALAAKNKCKLCHMERTIQCKDLVDTVTQLYDELTADMKAFQQRQPSRSLNQKAVLASDKTLNQCDSNDAEMKKL